MPFIYPRINIKINMQGLGPLMQRKIGTSFEPMDLYEVVNTAVAPNGFPYFNAVNDGTGIKAVRGAGGKLKSSKSTLRRSTIPGMNEVMTFFAGGIISQRVAGPNAPHHMRERVLPKIREYWKKRVLQMINGVKAEPISGGEKIAIMMDQFTSVSTKGLMEGGRTAGSMGNVPVTPNFTNPTSGGPSRYAEPRQGNFWTMALEDTMDYVVEQLQLVTPILKSEYDASAQGYTARPGLLRDSYVWQQVASITGVPGLSPKIGTSANRPFKSGRRQTPSVKQRIAHLFRKKARVTKSS